MQREKPVSCHVKRHGYIGYRRASRSGWQDGTAQRRQWLRQHAAAITQAAPGYRTGDLHDSTVTGS
jgi:hypothetical protein